VSGPPHAPAHHAAPLLRPPTRRAWVVIGVLVALTTLPMLAVVSAGRVSLDSPVASRSPYQQPDPAVPVIVDGDRSPGRSGKEHMRPAAQPPQFAQRTQPSSRGTSAAAGTAGSGPREESTCPGGNGPSTGSGGTGGTAGTVQPQPPASAPSATDPAAKDPAATDPAATDPAAADPAATDPPPGEQFYDQVYDELHLVRPVHPGS
jgi:hypothetical protein